MRLGNLAGRASLIRGLTALDINRASGGDLPADPMAYTSIDVQDKLRTLDLDRDTADFEAFDPQLLGPPVPRPSKILAIALNYDDHAKESAQEAPGQPVVFAKLPSSVCGPYDAISIPPGFDEVDYEAEVVVVIGKRVRGLEPGEVWSAIAGITGGQDISDRAEQLRPPISQYTVGKSYDTFSPIGPVLATIEEFSSPDDLGLAGWVSGQQVQNGRTAHLVHTIPALVSWVCRYITLEPGDLIFTGTPGGVGMQRTPQLFLRPGMLLETEVEGIGRMRNPIEETVPGP